MSVQIHIPRPPRMRDILHRRRPIVNVNKEHEESLTRLERLAIFISDHVGTPGFFIIILGWTLFWLGWNSLAPRNWRFDPYPAFVLWLFISNMIQIFLMPLIMVAQNLQSRHAEMRADSDYQVNISTEHEVEAILHHLEYQTALLTGLLNRMNIQIEEVPLPENAANATPGAVPAPAPGGPSA